MARRSTADDDLRAGEAAAVMHLADEVLDHLLGDFKVGDDAVAQGTDRGNVAGRAAKHELRLVADGEHLLLAFDLGDSDHRRLVEDDAAAFHIDEGIGRAEVDRHVRRQHAENSREHLLLLAPPNPLHTHRPWRPAPPLL